MRCAIPTRPALAVLALLVCATALATTVAAHRARAASHRTAYLSSVDRGGSQPRPIRQSAAEACLRTAPGVDSVSSDGHDLSVAFAGRAHAMRVRFLADADSAMLWAHAHGDDGNVWNNTNWFDTPARLTKREMDALGYCLPNGRRPARP